MKSGELVPEVLDAETALQLMLAEPLLIRRPLLQVGEQHYVGFDVDAIHAWIGLHTTVDQLRDRDLEGCPRSHATTPCPEPQYE